MKNNTFICASYAFRTPLSYNTRKIIYFHVDGQMHEIGRLLGNGVWTKYFARTTTLDEVKNDDNVVLSDAGDIELYCLGVSRSDAEFSEEVGYVQCLTPFAWDYYCFVGLGEDGVMTHTKNLENAIVFNKSEAIRLYPDSSLFKFWTKETIDNMAIKVVEEKYQPNKYVNNCIGTW